MKNPESYQVVNILHGAAIGQPGLLLHLALACGDGGRALRDLQREAQARLAADLEAARQKAGTGKSAKLLADREKQLADLVAKQEALASDLAAMPNKIEQAIRRGDDPAALQTRAKLARDEAEALDQRAAISQRLADEARDAFYSERSAAEQGVRAKHVEVANAAFSEAQKALNKAISESLPGLRQAACIADALQPGFVVQTEPPTAEQEELRRQQSMARREAEKERQRQRDAAQHQVYSTVDQYGKPLTFARVGATKAKAAAKKPEPLF